MSKVSLLEVGPRDGEHTIREEDVYSLIEELGDSLALIMIGGVNYFTGQVFPMQKITEYGHKVGAKVGFDLAHAAGNILLELHDWNVDFAAWCSYKYLNSGPGGISGIYINKKHHNSKLKRLEGWWGVKEDERFNIRTWFY